VTTGDRLVFTQGGEVVHDAPAASLADEGPVYDRPAEDWVHPHAAEDVDAEPPPADLEAAARAVLADPNLGSVRWVTEQYDGLVGSATVIGPGGDAAVLRLPGDREFPRGVAIAADGNGRWCALDPAEGARLVVAEAARNVACTGATPVAATNCLNFGSPERPRVMGAFRDVVRGMGEACRALGTPITGGNVSFYNATGDDDIFPTPVVGVLGVLDEVVVRVGTAFAAPGDVLYQVGAPTRPGLGGSAYLWATQGRVAGRPPRIDLGEERALQGLLIAAADAEWARSAHDVSAGGLLACVVESALPRRLGARLFPEPGVEPRQWLFSESPSRAVVSVRSADVMQFENLCAARGVYGRRLGVVTEQPSIEWQSQFSLDLADLAELSERALPAALGLQGTRVGPFSA
jgi:phosphoribosylformylglycinamidine (FGAM) synthase-like enzyme